MKLRNKRTGEIVEVAYGRLLMNFEDGTVEKVKSLAELNEEWEDVPEEPKDIQCIYYVNHFDAAKIDGVIVGFETKEEAEKAVEKLKAFKRLKDRGFEFINFPYKKICKYDARTGVGNLEYQVKYYEELEPDLDLLFGGEE